MNINFFTIFFTILLGLITPTITVVKSIKFDQECGGYLKQTADANTIELAAQRLDVAIKYAEEELQAEEINLGVFTNNEGALHCYQSVGFETTRIEKNAYNYYGEDWDCAEMILRK